MPWRPLPVALSALALGACAAPPRKPDLPSVSYRSQTAMLPTGMRVLAYEIAGGGLFSLAASYRAGSADDPPGKEGLAALVGRLVLRSGGNAGDRLGYSRRLLVAGVRFDAQVGRDTTDFLASGPASRLEAALAVEADRLRDPLAGVTEEEFRRERDLYAEELAEQRLASRNDAGSQWLLELALGSAPYARPEEGAPETVRALTLEDARAWARQRFTPAHLVVAATAPGAGTGVKILKAFGALATGEGEGVPAWARSVAPVPAPNFPVVTPELDGPAEPAVRRAPVSGVQLWIGWVLPGEASVDAARARAAAALAWHLVRRAAPDRETRERLRWRSSYGFTLAAVRIDAEREEDARKVLRRLRKGDAPGGFVAQVTAEVTSGAMLAAEYFQLEQPNVAFMAREVRLSQRGDALTEWRRKVTAGLSQGYEAWAERWLDPRRAVALLVLPEQGREEPTQATPPDAVPRWATTLPYQPQLPPGRYDVLDLVPPPGLASAHRTRLGNGLEVVVHRRSTFPRVEGRLVIRTRPSGTPEVPTVLPYLALASARPTFSLVGSLSCPFAEADFEGDRFVARSRGTTTHLEGILRDLSCWAGRITADDGMVDSARKTLQRRWKRWQGTPELAVSRLLWERLFPGWNGWWGDPAEIDAVPTAAVERWLESELRPDRATLILAGDVEPGPELSRAIEEAFGGWRVRRDAGAPAFPEVRRVEAPPAAVLLGHRAGARTAIIAVDLAAPPMAERDLAAEQAWIAEVRRVLARDRGEGGLGDVQVTWFDRATAPSAIFLETRVKAESTAWSLRRLLEALGGTAVAPASDGVTALWRWSLAVDLPFRFAGASDLADRLAEAAAVGGPPDFWERHRASLASLDGARIQQTARRLSVGRELVAVIGDREVLEPQLRAAGFMVQLVEAAPAAP